MTRIVRDDVTGGLLTVIQDQHTQSFHIVQITFQTETVYMSEGPEMTFDGHVFIEGRVRVSGLSWSSDGSQKCVLEILNVNGYGSALFLGNKIASASVRIWTVYMDSDSVLSTPIEYVVGSCDDSELTPESLRITISTSSSRTKFFPNEYVGGAGFNHLPVEGAVVFWNSTTYILEKAYG